jgi:hypothetical protein
MATATFTSMTLMISGVAGALRLETGSGCHCNAPAAHATECDEQAIARWFAEDWPY